MQLHICNIKDYVDHCKEKCRHGKPHVKDVGLDSCLPLEVCDITDKKVKCRKLFKREEKLLHG
jgi:hypothetical protein